MSATQTWLDDVEQKSDGESSKPEEAVEKGSNGSNGVFEDEPDEDQPTQDVEQRATPSSPPPPNGGYGWVCTVCVATINAHTWGLNSSYGVFLAHYLATNTFPGATPLDYAFVGSLSIAMAMLVSPIATTTTRLFGTHVTLFIGIVLEAGSLIGASFAKEIWQLFLSQGVCFGLGMGFLFIGSVGIVAQWFTTRRSLANGIAASGSGFGGLLYSLATGAMIKTIGLAWAFRVLGILAFVVTTICTILLRDRNKIIGSSHSAFEIGIFKRPEYLVLGSWGFFSLLAYVVLIFSLANYANFIGLNASQASLISALFNLGQALGRPPIGYFSDSMGRINMAGTMSFLSGLFALLIWVFAKSYGVLIFYSLIGGAVAGTFWATIAPVTAEVVGLKHVPSALNLMWLIIMLPSMFSEPIALEIVGGTGSYLGTQLFTGFMYIAAAMCLLLLRGWKIGELMEIAKMSEEKADKVDAVGNDGNMVAKEAGRRTFFKYCLKWQRV